MSEMEFNQGIMEMDNLISVEMPSDKVKIMDEILTEKMREGEVLADTRSTPSVVFSFDTPILKEHCHYEIHITAIPNWTVQGLKFFSM